MTEEIIAETRRICSRCGEEKLLAEFVGTKTGSINCRQCNSCRAYGNALRKRNPEKTKDARARAFVAWRIKHPKRSPLNPIISDEGRLCRTCNSRKLDSDFGRDERSKDGLAWRCHACAKKTHKRWRDRNSDHVRDVARGVRRERYKNEPVKDRKILRTSRLKKFGLTYEDFERMLILQGYKCDICAKEITVDSDKHSYAKSACVDHNHDTGKVRGLLCSRCNTGIGLLGDDARLLQIAADYLKRHSS